MSLANFSSPNRFSPLLDNPNPVRSPTETSLNSSSLFNFSLHNSTKLNSPNMASLSSSSSLFLTTAVEQTILYNDQFIDPESLIPYTQPSLFSHPPTPNSLFTSPLLSSTPISAQPQEEAAEPETQQLALRLADLRSVDGVDVVALQREIARLQRENESLRSEVTALRLQHEDEAREIDRLRLLPSPPSTEQQQKLNPTQSTQKQPQQAQSPPPPADSNEGYSSYVSKKKQQKMRKKERERAEAETTLPPGCTSLPTERERKRVAAETTLPPGCETNPHAFSSPASRPAPTSHPPPVSRPPPPTCRPPPPPTSRPPPPTSFPSPNPTIYVFHDSNLKNLTAGELKSSINSINNNNNNITNYNISPQETFTLPQTRDQIKRLTFKTNDIVIITTLTNDARHTKHRQARTTNETKHIQATIISHLKAFIPPKNIVILESPPLLTSSTSDIFPYNDASFLLARQNGARFARSLVGEHHLFRDGYHILKDSRHLLVKSVAAAAVNRDPHQHFKLRRPPHGNFGPWEAPNGQGMLPQPHTYRGVAMAQPINFRRASIRPLMNIKIQRPQY